MSNDLRVGTIMTSPVASIRAAATLAEVAAILADSRVGAVPVVDANRRVVVVASDVDLVAALLTGLDPSTHADRFMTAPVATLTSSRKARGYRIARSTSRSTASAPRSHVPGPGARAGGLTAAVGDPARGRGRGRVPREGCGGGQRRRERERRAASAAGGVSARAPGRTSIR